MTRSVCIRLGVGAIVVASYLLTGCNAAVEDVVTEATVAKDSSKYYRETARVLSEKTGAPVRVNSKAVAERTEFDFGAMDALSSGSHVFVVRNEGSAPLELQVLDTSCKCTLSNVQDEAVPPGQSTEVRMEWNTGDKVTYYRQWARIATNDPTAAELVFKIQGTVRQDIRFEPEVIRFDAIRPGNTQTADVLVFSQRLKHLACEQVTVTNPNIYHEVLPASAEQLAKHRATSGYIIRLHTPGELRSGSFAEYLQVVLRPHPHDARIREFTLPVEGRVLSRIAVLGKGIDQFGRIEFGALPYGRGAKARLIVKVRDPDTELSVRHLHLDPPGLRVQLERSSINASGLYDLEVEVPEETEPCAHRGDAMGTIRFEFDHPRVPQLELNVDFSVRPPRELP